MDEFNARLHSIDNNITNSVSQPCKEIPEYEFNLVQNDYAEILASCFREERSKRAKRDKSLRSKSRKLFDILSSLLNRVQTELPIESLKDYDGRPCDTNRCRDSDLRTLRKTNKTLEALIEFSREIKEKKREVKAIKKSEEKKSRKRKTISIANWSHQPPSRKLALYHESHNTISLVNAQEPRLSCTQTVINQTYPPSAGSIYPPQYMTYQLHYNS